MARFGNPRDYYFLTTSQFISGPAHSKIIKSRYIGGQATYRPVIFNFRFDEASNTSSIISVTTKETFSIDSSLQNNIDIVSILNESLSTNNISEAVLSFNAQVTERFNPIDVGSTLLSVYRVISENSEFYDTINSNNSLSLAKNEQINSIDISFSYNNLTLNRREEFSSDENSEFSYDQTLQISEIINSNNSLSVSYSLTAQDTTTLSLNVIEQSNQSISSSVQELIRTLEKNINSLLLVTNRNEGLFVFEIVGSTSGVTDSWPIYSVSIKVASGTTTVTARINTSDEQTIKIGQTKNLTVRL